MKKMLPELVGTAGFGLFVAGLHVEFGPGVAMIVGGALLLGAAIKLVQR